MKRILIVVALLLATVLLFASCADMASAGTSTDKWSLAYKQAQNLGYEGTLEEFLASIQGAGGTVLGDSSTTYGGG